MSTDPTDLTIKAGRPFAREIRAVGQAAVWPNVNAVEVRSQARIGRSEQYPLIDPALGNLHQFMDLRIDGADVVIDMALTGADTRALAEHITANTFYDVWLSDVGTTDERALQLLEGRLIVEHTITAA